MRRAALLLACLLSVGLAGCSGDKDEGNTQTREDCSDTQSFNAFEQRCVSSDFEVCRAWINGGIQGEDQEVSCQVDSDGKAWLDWGFGVSKAVHVTVTDGANKVVYENNIGSDQDRAKVTGAKGRWQLTVDFGGAAGTGEIYLWG